MLEKKALPCKTFAAVAAVSVLTGFTTVSSATAAQVDITNANGSASFPDLLLNSNGGLSSDQFAGTTNNGVSVWLRARNFGDQGPLSRSGNTFKIREDSGASGDDFYIDFQFSPSQGDTPTNSNYFLELRLDNDPSASVNFGANTNDFFARVFDADTDDELLNSGRSSGTASDRSWDDGDSVPIDGVTTRGTGSGGAAEAVDFQVSSGSRNTANLPDYVVVNSWAAEWDFPNFSLLGDDFGGAPGAGLYDVSLTAFQDNNGGVGPELASVQITAQVGEVPVPSSIALLGTALVGTGIVATRRRKVR